ncbi:MAG: hypothetical protein HN348_05945, partial [Proteobacteria bacterium]|nr:hypothetical protein [Pseudomonadota bacterium]
EADSKHRFPVLESRPTELAGPGVIREFEYLALGVILAVSIISSLAFLLIEFNDSTREGPTHDVMMVAFREYSGDDLLLEPAEFDGLLKSLFDPSEDEVKRLFKNADRNRNGFVDDFEFDLKSDVFIKKLKRH